MVAADVEDLCGQPAQVQFDPIGEHQVRRQDHQRGPLGVAHFQLHIARDRSLLLPGGYPRVEGVVAPVEARHFLHALARSHVPDDRQMERGGAKYVVPVIVGERGVARFRHAQLGKRAAELDGVRRAGPGVHDQAFAPAGNRPQDRAVAFRVRRRPGHPRREQ